MKVTQHVCDSPDDFIPTKLVGDKQGIEISYENMNMVSYTPQIQLFTNIPIFITSSIVISVTV